MKLVKSYGVSLQLFIKKADRVNFIAPADYEIDSEIEIIVKSIIKKIQAVEEMQSYY